jgi:hypothetical protein
MTKRDRKKADGPARPIRTKRDYEHATTVAKRLSGAKSLDSTAELRLQSLLKELDKYDSPEDEDAGENDPGSDYSGPRRRWSDDAAGSD